MMFNFKKKRTDTANGVAFIAAKDGGLAVNRKSLHDSPGFQRQLEALQHISSALKKPRHPVS